MVGMVSSDSASFPPGQGLAHLHAVPVDQHVAAESGEANEEAPQPRGGQMWPSGARRHPSPPPPPPGTAPRFDRGIKCVFLELLGFALPCLKTKVLAFATC